MTPQQQPLLPLRLNLDDELRDVKPDEARDILNTRPGDVQHNSEQARQNVLGNVLIPNTLPAGANRCIGGCSDERTGRLFAFYRNTQSNHCIYEFMRQTSTFEHVYTDIHLDFDDAYLIKGTKADLINDRYLKFTDNYNPMRSLDVTWAKDNKKRKWRLAIYTTGPGTTIEVRNGGTILATAVMATQLTASTTGAGIINLTVSLQPWITATYRSEQGSEWIELEAVAVNTIDVVVTTNDAYCIPENYYTNLGALTYTRNERMIDACAWTPNIPPTFTYKIDSGVETNFLHGKTYQFRTAVVYRDGRKSALGPWSSIATESFWRGEGESPFNYIEVDFSDAYYDDIGHLSMIEYVEIYFRNGNNGTLKLVKRIHQTELGRGAQVFNFYDDTEYTEQSNEVNTKQFDDMPLLAGAQVYADNRMAYGDIVKNYNNGHFDAEVVPGFTETKIRRFNISAVGRIYNEDFHAIGSGSRFGYIANNGLDGDGAATMDCFGGYFNSQHKDNAGTFFEQWTPLSGFVGYLTGTPHFGVTRQRIDGEAFGVPLAHAIATTSTGAIDMSDAANETEAETYLAAGGAISQVLNIRNVAAGKYVVRIASHWCDFEDSLGKGRWYNLRNGLSFQETSTHVFRWSYGLGGTTWTMDETEVTVEITEAGNFSVSHPSMGILHSGTAGTDGGVYIGEFWVEDLISYLGTTDVEVASVTGYLKDADGGTGSSVQEDIKRGVFMERQKIELKGVDGGSVVGSVVKTLYTDHNGFFYFRGNNTPGQGSFALKVTSVDAGTGTPLVVKDYTDRLYFYRNPSLDPYRFYHSSILKGLDEEALQFTSAVFATSFIQGVNDLGHGQILIYNHNPIVSSDCRTLITGAVKDQNGAGIAGVLTVYQNSGRWEKTASDGTFSILVYGDAKRANNDRVDNLIFNTDISRQVTFAISNQPYETISTNITPFGTGNYDFDTNYTVADIIATVAFLNNLAFFKSGGYYELAFAHRDRSGRLEGLITRDDFNLKLPFLTELLENYPELGSLGTGPAYGVFDITINLLTPPPIWATDLYVYRTRNAAYNDYLQFVCDDIKYIVNYDDSVTPATLTETTAGTGTARFVLLNVSEATANYQREHPGSTKGYTFTDGDRLRFIRNGDGASFPFVDSPIVGVVNDYLVVEYLDSLNEVFPGTMVEIYTPKLNTNEKFYYEIGHIKINSPYTNTRAYASTSIALTGGDTYRRDRVMLVTAASDSSYAGTYTELVEDHSASDFYVSRAEDIGRPNIDDPNFKQIHQPDGIAWSDPYIEGSARNGHATFDALNNVTGHAKNGRITILGYFENVMFIAQERKCHTRYINKEMLRQALAGGTVSAASDRFLSKPDYLEQEVGCTNPESVALTRNDIYAIDLAVGVFWRYSVQNGIVNISGFDSQYKNSNKIDNFAKARSFDYIKTKQIDNLFMPVQGWYDALHEEYILAFIGGSTSAGVSTFPGIGANIGEDDPRFVEITHGDIDLTHYTIAFSEKWRGWWFYSFNPEMILGIGNVMLSFVNGAGWKHHDSAPYCNFYGVQYPQRIQFVFNKDYFVKQLRTIHLDTNKQWSIPTDGVEIAPHDLRPLGQKSDFPDGAWEGLDRGYYGAFYFDKLTPGVAAPLYEGDDLAGQAALITIENTYNTQVLLWGIKIGYTVPAGQPVL